VEQLDLAARVSLVSQRPERTPGGSREGLAASEGPERGSGGPTRTSTRPDLASLPTSSSAVPSQAICVPTTANAFSTNSRTGCVSPAADRVSSVAAAQFAHRAHSHRACRPGACATFPRRSRARGPCGVRTSRDLKRDAPIALRVEVAQVLEQVSWSTEHGTSSSWRPKRTKHSCLPRWISATAREI